MRKRLYYLLANVFYNVNNSLFEYFHFKAEAIVEKEYNKLIEDFYENDKGYYGE